MFDKWIEALAKYKKHHGSFVPISWGYDNSSSLHEENCACAIGVYLIEIKGIPAAEIAMAGYDTEKYWDIIGTDLGTEFSFRMYHINDGIGRNFGQYKSDNFDFVIEELKRYSEDA
jgi:hypothetical protein